MSIQKKNQSSDAIVTNSMERKSVILIIVFEIYLFPYLLISHHSTSTLKYSENLTSTRANMRQRHILWNLHWGFEILSGRNVSIEDRVKIYPCKRRRYAESYIIWNLEVVFIEKKINQKWYRGISITRGYTDTVKCSWIFPYNENVPHPSHSNCSMIRFSAISSCFRTDSGLNCVGFLKG